MLGHLVGRIVFGGCVDHALNDGAPPQGIDRRPHSVARVQNLK
jgi:hypothetical protein